jgi:hypothetical protein
MHESMPALKPRTNPRKDPRWVEARFDRIAPWYSVVEPLFFVPSITRREALRSLRLRFRRSRVKRRLRKWQEFGAVGRRCRS